MLGFLIYCIGYIVTVAWMLVWYDKNRHTSDFEEMDKPVIYLIGAIWLVLLPFMILITFSNKLAEFIKKHTK